MPELSDKPFASVVLTSPDVSDAARHAGRLIRDEPALISSLDFGRNVAQGDSVYPKIVIGDQSEISLVTLTQQPVLDHRMALLAGEGDVVVLSAPDEDFAHYIRTTLRRKGVDFISAGLDLHRPVTDLCRTKADLRRQLERRVTHNGGATILPYLTTGRAWRLAQSLGEATGKIIHVAGPAPRIARRINDKLWFSELARQVLGVQALPPTLRAYGPTAAAGLVKRLARKSDHIVIKVPNSAGSAGNIRLRSDQFVVLPLSIIHRFLRRQLNNIGWQGRYPLLVGVWDSNVVSSPSVQIWVPLPQDGAPIVNGVFEQIVQGDIGTFVGGERSSLPDRLQVRLALDALRIAAVLQQVGYYGPCSFDAVIVRGDRGELYPHWIECNGRWGGVSIPMRVAKKLAGGTPSAGLTIVQTNGGEKNLTTRSLLTRLEPLLYRPGQTNEGLVVLAPPQARPEGKLTLMAVATTQTRARRLMETALSKARVATQLTLD